MESKSAALTSTVSALRELESEERFRLIVDTIPGFVCTLNAAGEIELLNRQVLEYFGKTTGELKNWAISDAVHPDDLPRVIEAWQRSLNTGESYEIEFRQRRAPMESTDGSNHELFPPATPMVVLIAGTCC